MTNTPKGGKRLENSPRFQRFKTAYLESSNAYQSALAAGYSESFASSKSCELAARVAHSGELSLARLFGENPNLGND